MMFGTKTACTILCVSWLFLVAFQDVALQLAAIQFTDKAFGDEPPNVLFIYTDDQSHRTVGCYPDAFDWVKTPNLDRLASQGVRFNHAYIGSWCMPSRATMLTGFHQHGIESMRMEGRYPGSAYDPELCRFWPSYLREQGYVTAQIGKWHTGVDAGFGRDWDYQIVWNRPRHPDNAPNYYDNQLISFHGGAPEMVEGYTTDNYTNWAIEFIEAQGRPQTSSEAQTAAGKPWYLWLCYGAVHGPFTPADRHRGEYSDHQAPIPPSIYPPRPGKPKYVQEMNFWESNGQGIPVERKARDTVPVGMKDFPGRPLRDWIRQYHQGVLAIDEGVGQILQALRDSGQDENTLIVFTSDQGFAWGQHGFKSKVAPYRGTVEAPLIIRPPRSQQAECAGRVISEPVSGVDIAPTILSYANVKQPWPMHGHDLKPLMGDQAVAWQHPAMLVHTGKKYGSETDAVPPSGDPALLHGPGVPWYVMLARGEFKYVRTLIAGETEELYNLRTDPDELHNLAQSQEYQGLLSEFREETLNELERTEAGMVDSLPSVGTPVVD